MIEGLKPYSAYKDSGLPWVGKTPTHWDLVPNRGLVKKRKILVGKRHREYQLLSLTKQGVIVRDISTGKGKFSADMGTSQEVRIGDFVFCLFDVPETPRAVGLSRHQGMITGAYTVLEFLGRGNASYFEKFYLAMDDRKLLSPLYSGLRHTIPIARFLGAKTPLPPPDEQAAIVKFLDYANGKIERAIRAKRKLIGLLNEQKQAIIHRAVTRGLDPNVKLKPSGIPWLGDVPEHWEVLAIKRLATVLNGFAFSSEDYTEFGVPLIRIGDLKSNGSVDVQSAAKLSVNYLTSHNFVRIVNGDLLMAMTGATIGKVSHYTNTHPALLNQRVCAFRARLGKVEQDYLFLMLSSRPYISQVLMACYGGAQPNISDNTLSDFKMPVAPFDLQKAIIAQVGSETSSLNKIIGRTEHEIDLLREYRTTLTAEVVTGKLDVREAAKRLPDEEVETLPTDDSMDEMIEDKIDQEDDA